MMNLIFLSLVLLIPNCLQIDDNRYLDKTEVTNKSYAWFLQDADAAERPILYPSAVFKEVYGKNYIELNPDDSTMKKPIIGLSEEQCLAFCKWRTEKVNAKNPKIEVVFELPNISDYEMALESPYYSKSKSGEIYGYNSRFLGRNTKKFEGLKDNVSELTADGSIYKGKSDAVGFRCVAVVQ